MNRRFQPNRNRWHYAFTLLELAVVVVILVIAALGASILLPVFARRHQSYSRIGCVNNLKQIGVAYRVWANDNNEKYPAMSAIAGGTNAAGWGDFLTNQNQGALCWTNYFILQNELGQSPKILVCPEDDRTAALDFTKLHNTNISYFVGAGASDAFPQSILGGDRNLNAGWTSQNNLGFSPANGNGNDIAIQTNSGKSSVSWTLKMHSKGRSTGAGNILLGDASVQQVDNKRLRTDYLPFALDHGNWPSNHVPVEPSIRLIFP